MYHYSVHDYWTPEECDYAFPTEEERDQTLKIEIDEFRKAGYEVKSKDGEYSIYMDGVIEYIIYTY